MDTSEIFTKLQSALAEVKSTKDDLAEISAKVNQANDKYQKAVKTAADLRAELDAALNSQMGETDTRVRTSS